MDHFRASPQLYSMGVDKQLTGKSRTLKSIKLVSSSYGLSVAELPLDLTFELQTSV